MLKCRLPRSVPSQVHTKQGRVCDSPPNAYSPLEQDEPWRAALLHHHQRLHPPIGS
jgi:hypothetical protein